MNQVGLSGYKTTVLFSDISILEAPKPLGEWLQVIKNAEISSTAKIGEQVATPRNLAEQLLWKEVEQNPLSGSLLKNMNGDKNYSPADGFQKMEMTKRLSDGTSISIHYQYNYLTEKAYDIKITSPGGNGRFITE